MPGIGVDTKRLSPRVLPESEVARIHQELGLTPPGQLLLMMAEFIPRKHHQDALRAFARLGRPHVHLALAGDGPLREPMQQLAADLGISDRVHFLGFRSDIPALIRASVALLLPSEREGLPRSILEALSLGVPAIGADISGVRDLLGEESGLLVKLGDVEGLAQAMAWMLDHPDEARAMGQRGREQVVANNELRRIITLHDELYTKALEG